MAFWRCTNCKAEFEADAPKCEACELDPSTNAADGQYFMPLVVVHFDPPTKVAGRGKNHPACDPKVRFGTVTLTSHPGAVTCQACKETDAYKAAGGEPGGINPAFFSQAAFNQRRG